MHTSCCKWILSFLEIICYWRICMLPWLFRLEKAVQNKELELAEANKLESTMAQQIEELKRYACIRMCKWLVIVLLYGCAYMVGIYKLLGETRAKCVSNNIIEN